MKVFHYISGEEIMVGDRVREVGRDGYVEEIIQPGSDMAVSCGWLDGGVCTVMIWGDKQGRVLWQPPDGEFWEDLEFVGRRQ
jgi:hypothetical protein